MRLGSFGMSGDIETIARAGFDSAELDLMEISRLTEEQFQKLKKLTRDSGLGFEAFSGFMPLTERIHDPAFPVSKWLAHAELCARRTRELGAVLWPMGAGKCRSIPEGCTDIPSAKARVADFFGRIAEILAEYDITLAVEPLGPANSNYLQTIGDTVAFARALSLPNCRVMCDLRHMIASNDPLDAIPEHIRWIAHAHVDYPLGPHRRFPSQSDGFNYLPYLSSLKKSGYQGIVTVEATSYTDLFPEAARSAAYLRELWTLA
jgi:sugar phosphate isomerase/epimerase